MYLICLYTQVESDAAVLEQAIKHCQVLQQQQQQTKTLKVVFRVFYKVIYNMQCMLTIT